MWLNSDMTEDRSVNLDRVEAELAAALLRADALENELKAARDWAEALQTSATVLRRLAGLPEANLPLAGGAGLSNSPPSPRKPVARGQLVADAATAILRREGRRFKSVVLGEMLNDQGFDIGRGRPARVTSDLSNQLARYAPHLLGSRVYGWGLREWGDETAPGPGPDREHLNAGAPTPSVEPSGAIEGEGSESLISSDDQR